MSANVTGQSHGAERKTKDDQKAQGEQGRWSERWWEGKGSFLGSIGEKRW